jgi:hypothetical protein
MADQIAVDWHDLVGLDPASNIVEGHREYHGDGGSELRLDRRTARLRDDLARPHGRDFIVGVTEFLKDHLGARWISRYGLGASYAAQDQPERYDRGCGVTERAANADAKHIDSMTHCAPHCHVLPRAAPVRVKRGRALCRKDMTT